MSTADESWRPAVVPDLPEQANPMVRIGPAEGNEIRMTVALGIMALWHNRAPASVGTALTAREAFELIVPLLTPEVLEVLLTRWRDAQPALFAAYLGEAFTGARPSRQRGPNKPKAQP